MENNSKPTNPNWQELLTKAVNEPGVISEAYSRFWNYSVGNQILAVCQLYGRKIPIGPIASYNRWKELGRFVKKGEKAITLCMPITVKKKNDQDQDDEYIKCFVFRNNWFALAQTDGKEYTPEPIPNWNRATALNILEIKEEAFYLVDGNTQGFARTSERAISINPLADMPHKTTFHEIAHVLLHRETDGGVEPDGANTPKNLKEVEAESVALICCEALGLPGAEFSRGYIQNWLQGAQSIPERSAQKIFHAADLILRAGRLSQEVSNASSN